MELTREVSEIRKHYRRYHQDVGEAVIWYEFVPFAGAASAGSTYDDVYDTGEAGTGGRRWAPGVVVPVLLITESEDAKRAIPDARQPVETTSFVASMQDFRDAGITTPWEYQNHLNDMFQYDGRYFTVSTYRVRGRGRDDILVVVEGTEIYISEELVNDPDIGGYTTSAFPWPATLPGMG